MSAGQGSFRLEDQAVLSAFSRMSRSVGDHPDYVQGGGGNTSAKFADGRMAIKASGFRLSDIRPDAAYAVLDGKAVRHWFEAHEEKEFEDVEKAGSDFVKANTLAVEGLPSLRPSVEAGFHSLLDTFVVHSHSVYANLATCIAEGRDILAKALAGADYSFGFVPYVDPGARLTFRIRDELARVTKETGRRPAVLLMQNHGLIVHADDPDRCLELHEDANARIAAAFGLTSLSFPEVALKDTGDGRFESATPYLQEKLRTGRYDRAFFLESPLYPDQMVFLIGTFDVGAGQPAEGACLADLSEGAVRYRLSQAAALTIEQTMTCVVFIAETAKARGFTLSTMGEAARRFIANWESEKYRKTLAGKKP